jgi:uncharacterized membrane protein
MSTDERELRDPSDDTGRLEAFSDGVFAVAITLLALGLGVPDLLPAQRAADVLDGNLLRALTDAKHWPEYLAYVISFTFILVMWINHHTLFKLIKRSDRLLLLLNGLLLLLVTAVPFSTALLATYIYSRTAAAVYTGLYVLIAIGFNLLWRHASAGGRLLDEEIHPRHASDVTKGFRFGWLYYAIAFLLVFVNPYICLAANIILAALFALPPRWQRTLMGGRRARQLQVGDATADTERTGSRRRLSGPETRR